MRNQILGNRYRILDRIGEGGMAVIYVALDEKLGRKVAIKVLHEHMEKNPDIRKRFQMESQAVSALEHPNIVKIYDFSGEHSDRLWIVTEVIRGKNLAQYIQHNTSGSMDPILASCIVREIVKALAKAHQEGIVHRDIKPENAMITDDGRVKLMDFGIAKDLAKSGLTQTGTFMGSPSYMSPEQIRGRDVDHRSDLYSLSVLYYEIVTGRLPFIGQTTHDVVLKIMEGEFTYPRFLVPNLPREIDEMIVHGMARAAGDRFSSAREFGQVIDRFLGGLGFDESHIELERYFKDPERYRLRLERTGLAATQAIPATRGKRRPTQATSSTQTGTRGTDQPTASRHARPNHHTANASDARSSRIQTEAAAAQARLEAAAAHAARQEAAAQEAARQASAAAAAAAAATAAAINARERQRTQLPHRVPTPPPAQQNRAPAAPAGYPHHPSVPPAARPMTQYQAANALAQAPGRAPAHAPLPAYMPAAVYEPVIHEPADLPRRARPVARPRAVRRHHYGDGRHQLKLAPSWSSSILGIILVAIIGAIGLWGFIELERRLSQPATKNRPDARSSQVKRGEPAGAKIGGPSSSESTTTKKPGSGKRRDGTPAVVRTIARPAKDGLATKPPQTSRPERPLPKPGKTTSMAQNNKPATKPTAKPKATPKATRLPELATIVSPPETVEINGAIVETTEIKKRKPEVVSTDANEAKNEASDSDQEAAPTPSGREKASPPAETPDLESKSKPAKPEAGGGKGRVQISSQPAAELFLDGKRVGTTNDNMTASSFHTLTAGSHSLELRRQGYTTFRTRFTLESGEQKTLPRIVLEAENSAAAKAALTLRVNSLPAQVTIRNLDSNATQAFVMKSSAKIVPLEGGRYHVRIEYNGQIKERELMLGGSQSQLTFSADFETSE